MNGKVCFVGAGPGDPGLITLRGLECLRAADVVLYDYLASSQLLVHARPDAELVCLGRHGRERIWTQSEINDALVRYAKQGRMVVRLKGGDPLIFARAGEELAAVEAEGLPYEIVPGITAAQSAGSHAGIPLTHRDNASCVAFVTGQEFRGKDATEELDYAALGRFPGTLVFYMGITTAPSWSSALLSGGKSPDTPVAIVRRCSLPDQECTFTTLGELGGVISLNRMRPPAIVIVGDVARQRGAVNWFTSRPLFGQRVLVTRPENQAHDLTRKMQLLGADVLLQPAIQVEEPNDWSETDAVIHRLAQFDWLVFSSANGVNFFLRRLFALNFDLRQLGRTKLAVIGPGTADALAAFHLRPDLQPGTFRAESLAEALAPHVRGKHVAVARTSRGREVLAEMLEAAGAHIEQAVTYVSRDVATPSPEAVDAVSKSRVDWTTVTSPAIARSLVQMFGDNLRNTKLAAISPLTAEALIDEGYPPAVVAEVYTTDGLITAILQSQRGKL
jgi:uroporphyrinogen III methyltransferase/synthase